MDFQGQAVDEPVHPYMLSSPTCWKLDGEVLAREYSSQDYWLIHCLMIDTYALQHPGVVFDKQVKLLPVTEIASAHVISNDNG